MTVHYVGEVSGKQRCHFLAPDKVFANVHPSKKQVCCYCTFLVEIGLWVIWFLVIYFGKCLFAVIMYFLMYSMLLMQFI